MKRKLFGSMTALAAAMLAFSCSDEITWPGGGSDDGIVDDGMTEVTFSVRTEKAATRAKLDDPDTHDGHGPGWKQTVGRGSEIDMLIYAVYETVETEENGVKETSYTLLSQYGQGIAEDLLESAAMKMTDDAGEKYRHLGQTIVYNPFGQDAGNNGEYPITLRLVRGKEYTIAFWAQSSKSEAYVTDDLEKVRVIYGSSVEPEETVEEGTNTEPEMLFEGMKNNDETRDAFCKKETFTVGTSGVKRDVILTRPLAQINVGTSGADYWHNAGDLEKEVRESTITLYGVAQQLNVVTDLVVVDDAAPLVNVKFDLALIPAYRLLEKIPTEMYKDGDRGYNYTDFGPIYRFAKTETNTEKGEEFLYVDLNQDGYFRKYKETYPTRNKAGVALTETFKYLSMNYVLVPATPKAPQAEPDSGDPDKYYSTTLAKVVFWFEADDEVPGFPPITLTNVPVHRNWRTNILGGLYYVKDPHDNTPDGDDPHKPDPDNPGDPNPEDYPDPENPNDPDNPYPQDEDDPTTVFENPYISVDHDPTYIEDHDPSWHD